jgi:hypothetical protein
MKESSILLGIIMKSFFNSILSFIIQSLTGTTDSEDAYVQIIDQVFEKINNLLTISAYWLSGLVLLLVGVLVSYFNLLAQYDRVGTVVLGAVPTGGLVLSLIGSGIIYNASKTQSNKTNQKKQRPIAEQQANQSPPIEQAIALLIMDFIKEREQARELIDKSNTTLPKHQKIEPDELNIH